MQYRKMPKSEDKLSVLGYGCMRMPNVARGVASRLIKKDLAIKQIRGAIDRGINYLDTAWPYHMGASESFLGEYILKDGYRQKVNIATKLPCMLLNKKRRVREIFNRQLQKLQADYIDYYLLHALNGAIWDKMVSFDIINFMDRIKREGKIRYMGFSFHGRYQDFTRIIENYNWDFAQVQFNILDENFQAGIKGIKYAAGKNMGIIVMSPLRGGSLVGKMPREIKQIYDRAPVKRSAADWAFRWIYNHPEVTLVLSGMNNEEHINENIKIASDALPDSLTKEELTIINSARDKYLELMQVGCTGCGYCMPCPAGINIPQAFKYLNNYHMAGKLQSKAFYMAFTGIMTDNGKPGWTTACIDCGKCEKACPQNIKIRKELKKVHKDLEGIGVRTAASIVRPLFGYKKKG